MLLHNRCRELSRPHNLGPFHRGTFSGQNKEQEVKLEVKLEMKAVEDRATKARDEGTHFASILAVLQGAQRTPQRQHIMQLPAPAISMAFPYEHGKQHHLPRMQGTGPALQQPQGPFQLPGCNIRKKRKAEKVGERLKRRRARKGKEEKSLLRLEVFFFSA